MRKNQIILYTVLVLLVLIQFIPVDLSNPAQHSEPAWDSPKTKDYFYRACADCHSNRAEFPFYSKIAPFSWLISYDISEGRKHFNISNGNLRHADEASREVSKEAMPLPIYTLMHSKAKFTVEETAEFLKGLEATFGKANEELHRESWSK